MAIGQPLLTNWENPPLISAKMRISILSWISSTENSERPKHQTGSPSWNLSLVLHQLIKAPFEPLKEASLEHLTFKTVSLLAINLKKIYLLYPPVASGGYFSLTFATLPPRVERKLHQLGSPNLQDIFIGG